MADTSRIRDARLTVTNNHGDGEIMDAYRAIMEQVSMFAQPTNRQAFVLTPSSTADQIQINPHASVGKMRTVSDLLCKCLRRTRTPHLTVVREFLPACGSYQQRDEQGWKSRRPGSWCENSLFHTKTEEHLKELNGLSSSRLIITVLSEINIEIGSFAKPS